MIMYRALYQDVGDAVGVWKSAGRFGCYDRAEEEARSKSIFWEVEEVHVTEDDPLEELEVGR